MIVSAVATACAAASHAFDRVSHLSLLQGPGRISPVIVNGFSTQPGNRMGCQCNPATQRSPGIRVLEASLSFVVSGHRISHTRDQKAHRRIGNYARIDNNQVGILRKELDAAERTRFGIDNGQSGRRRVGRSDCRADHDRNGQP